MNSLGFDLNGAFLGGDSLEYAAIRGLAAHQVTHVCVGHGGAFLTDAENSMLYYDAHFLACTDRQGFDEEVKCQSLPSLDGVAGIPTSGLFELTQVIARVFSKFELADIQISCLKRLPRWERSFGYHGLAL